VILFADMPPNFFDYFCTKTLSGGGILNDDDLTDLTWSLWMGCA
jgi:hypothetical protein